MRGKLPLILTSDLTKPPRYYVTRHYRLHSRSDNPDRLTVVVTGEKFDVTDQIEAIIEKARKVKP